MGLFANAAKQVKEETAGKFAPLELDEINVHAIFNRCLSKEGAAETVSSILYYKELGYEKEDLGVTFDKNALIANRKILSTCMVRWLRYMKIKAF